MARRLVRIHTLLIGCICVALAGCASSATPSPTPASAPPTPAGAKLTLTSSAFNTGEPIPRPYTCDGGDQSPPLSWSEPPAATQSLALVADDPDAPGGTWVHWVIYNLSSSARSLPEGIPPDASGPEGSRQGRNSAGRLGYGGPCPPAGSTHHYFFKLYALDILPDVPSEPTAAQLQSAMDKHILAYGELVGTYAK
ncbi:MAG: YbhB/YbcL family Raf kinase inhibitor-like protein [Chloroflexia bacterium]